MFERGDLVREVDSDWLRPPLEYYEDEGTTIGLSDDMYPERLDILPTTKLELITDIFRTYGPELGETND